MNNNYVGFSMANRKAELNLREQRKKKLEEQMDSFNKIFDYDEVNSVIQKARAKSSKNIKVQKNINQEEYKKLKDKSQKNQEWQDFHEERNKFKQMQIEKLKKNQEEYNMKAKNEVVEKNVVDLDEERNKMKERKRPSTNIQKRPEKPFPGPGEYDIAGYLDLNKGFTFGAKLKNSNEINIKYKPDYVLLESDIDEMLRKTHTTFTANRRFERFQPTKPQYVEITEEDRMKKFKPKTAKENYKKNEKFETDLQYMKELQHKRNENLKNKQVLPRMSSNPHDITPGPGSYNPYFNDFNPEIGGKPEDAFIPKDFEVQAPKFSLSGKPTTNCIFNISEKDDKPLDQSLSFMPKNAGELPKLPDYNLPKENWPNFSFPRSIRFIEEVNSKLPGPNEYFKESDLEKYEKELSKNPNQIL